MSWLKWFFDFTYRFSKPPWDSGVTPPEVADEIAEGRVKVGRALDLGCGTGTNSIYLAQHGFKTFGVDFSPHAIELARAKARRAGVHVDFYINDVTRLDFFREPFDFILDIGCFHGLDWDSRDRYFDNLVRLTCPGALFMLYALGPRPARMRKIGATPQEVRKLFGRQFALRRFQQGTDRGNRDSAWYWFTRL